MAKLVTGRIDDADELQRTLAALDQAGFDKREYGAFYVGPAGMHDKFPIGGDAYRDAGTEESAGGAATGAAMGGAAGLAVGAVAAAAFPFGIAAALAATGVGAYVGSLMGAISQTRHASRDESTQEHPAETQGGMRIAVNVERPGNEERAYDILHRMGARDIVPAEGEWRDGQWKDFDPRVPADQTRS